MKRIVEIVVISDVHLGTYGAHAYELNKYLKSVSPNHLILNGDIIDIWQFRKSYFPQSHLKVIKTILKMASNGTKVTYITGNHDEAMRRFSPTSLGNIHIVDKLTLDLQGKKTWIFHGDVFDASIQHSKWIAKLGGYGYDLLIVLNRLINWILERLGKERYSLSKRIKNSVKGAVKFISDFENTATELAIENNFDTVICGHIHQPQKRVVTNRNGQTLYLNSGDWIENLSALEYSFGEWQIIYNQPVKKNNRQQEVAIEVPQSKELIDLVMNYK